MIIGLLGLFVLLLYIKMRLNILINEMEFDRLHIRMDTLEIDRNRNDTNNENNVFDVTDRFYMNQPIKPILL